MRKEWQLKWTEKCMIRERAHLFIFEMEKVVVKLGPNLRLLLYFY
jgi:hypothetical protein